VTEGESVTIKNVKTSPSVFLLAQKSTSLTDGGGFQKIVVSFNSAEMFRLNLFPSEPRFFIKNTPGKNFLKIFLFFYRRFYGCRHYIYRQRKKYTLLEVLPVNII